MAITVLQNNSAGIATPTHEWPKGGWIVKEAALDVWETYRRTVHVTGTREAVEYALNRAKSAHRVVMWPGCGMRSEDGPDLPPFRRQASDVRVLIVREPYVDEATEQLFWRKAEAFDLLVKAEKIAGRLGLDRQE